MDVALAIWAIIGLLILNQRATDHSWALRHFRRGPQPGQVFRWLLLATILGPLMFFS